MLNLSEVKKIADLAKINISDTEAQKYLTEFNNILEYIDSLSDCDTKSIDEKHNLEENFYGNNTYEDKQSVKLVNKIDLLRNATQGRSANGYIKTSPIVSLE